MRLVEFSVAKVEREIDALNKVGGGNFTVGYKMGAIAALTWMLEGGNSPSSSEEFPFLGCRLNEQDRQGCAKCGTD